MSQSSRDKMKVAAELVRKGAVILAEPCQRCGGMQVRYHGKVYCTNHDDLGPLLSEEAVSYESVVGGVRALLLSKLNEAALLLEREKDPAKQDQLVSLMTKYFDLLQKMPQKQQSP
ncbi:MAG: hypothetical protein LYZ70_01375 [Nitrososphaerales archaeon]|nr:hypothetical protein [Nitrososphaerales archaeon]